MPEYKYTIGGCLENDDSTYVKRKADDELYKALQKGKFCYVLNSRQVGKSSLRVRTMNHLSSAGVECASIDLSSVSIQSATQENWYADFIVKLIDSFFLDLDFKQWWEKSQINSPLMRFTNFLEKHLLVEIEENIVIFIDEIDSVLSLDFPTDDFFAFIRACYNQRVDNPSYKRLTFCLLGVASPGNLIRDKSRTPFNIGKAIFLKSFQLDETGPLIRGLQGKFSEPKAVMQEILDWTGGQPFLTQKLCQLMVEESEKEHPRTVEKVVKSQIIENWESQDEPEHLRTIRDRILRYPERAEYLLELYQQICLTEGQSQITADNTSKQSELLLSGLVSKQEGKLRVYNPIYKEVFNQNWVENKLRRIKSSRKEYYIEQYIFSGVLPENAYSYVIRSADSELYAGLKEGKFCYVLNSRQSGKSSLRVRTMQRLRKDGVECAAIDLSAGGIQNVSPEEWYADLIDTLIDSFDLDVDFEDWWSENQLNSLVTRFRKFIEGILLVEIKENIVIFIDEIDSVLSLNFPTDDFFAFIRACYNQRVDNPVYNRLTFCLLGVASPGNLIKDKQRTPFNIGKAISLKGFQLYETEPLIKGLQDKFSEPETVMQEILDWTGGQPFLTQKLCQLMVEDSEQEHLCTVEEVVKSRIIESWDSQDEPEHLRTIRSRILRNEERAGYLLELYQQIRCSEDLSQVQADNRIEQSELLLSGLVAKQEGKLRVYNRIYQEVFNQNWVENELKNLRPYSESFKFWVASGSKDESRLLRGKALAGAEKWAKDKNLSYQDKQFLAASREKEIQEKIAAEEQGARLERERKDREAAEQINRVLSEASRKAKQRIRIGSIILVLTMLGTLILVTIATNQVLEAQKKLQELELNP